MRSRDYNLKHIMLVGYSRAAEAYVDRILANPQWGYFIHGILDDKMAVGTRYKKTALRKLRSLATGFMVFLIISKGKGLLIRAWK